jgi:hypothetical protein
MNLYRIQAIEDGVLLATRYAGSAIDARTTRKELIAQFDVSKGKVLIEECDLSTKKVDLLETLNELCANGDYIEPEGK